MFRTLIEQEKTAIADDQNVQRNFNGGGKPRIGHEEYGYILIIFYPSLRLWCPLFKNLIEQHTH